MHPDDATVVGIDPDTVRLSLVITRKRGQKVPEVMQIPLAGESNHIKSCGIAFRKIGEVLHDLTSDNGAPYVFLEMPVMGAANGRALPGPTISQAQIGGAVTAAAEEFECPISWVHNMSWKKIVCGKGTIAKTDIPGVMTDVWPELVKAANGDQNIIDAGAINLFGRDRAALVYRLKSRRKKNA